MSSPLQCVDLDAGYGVMKVVRGLDLAVQDGEILALLGPNGAGKTTTLLTLAGILPPLGGTISRSGVPLPRRRPAQVAKQGVSLVPDDRALYGSLNPEEHLRVAASGKDKKQRVAEALDHFPSLRKRIGVPAAMLSGGEQQMLALARALVSRPRVLLIDELSMGLAPIIVADLLRFVRTIADDRKMAVVMVEQHVQLALEVSDRAMVVVHGERVLESSARDLAANPALLESSYLGG